MEKEYAARFPGASFKHEIVAFEEYPTKFTIMAAAGTVPDVMSTSNAWMRDFWALGGLTALDDLVKKAPDVAYSKFVPRVGLLRHPPGEDRRRPHRGARTAR